MNDEDELCEMWVDHVPEPSSFRADKFTCRGTKERDEGDFSWVQSQTGTHWGWSILSAQVLLARVLLPTVQMKRRATRREKQKFCQSFPNNLLQLYVHLINYNRIHWTPGMKLGLNKRYACTRLKNWQWFLRFLRFMMFKSFWKYLTVN